MNRKFASALAPKISQTPRSFSLPQEVIDDPSLGMSERRSILSEWASDVSAIEGYPTLRWLSGTNFPVTFSSIVDAREKLDRLAAEKESRLSPSPNDALDRVVIAEFARRKIAQGDDGR